MKLKFYKFTQNNSGGSFSVDKNLCHRLFIQAFSYEEARDKAESLGVYFDGVGDCSCCGDRWSDFEELISFPHKWDKGKTFKGIVSYARFLAKEYGWTTPDIRIFYKNGKVKEIT